MLPCFIARKPIATYWVPSSLMMHGNFTHRRTSYSFVMHRRWVCYWFHSKHMVWNMYWSTLEHNLFMQSLTIYAYHIHVKLLHLHEIVEGLYFRCSVSVCVCVCLCVRHFLWTKFQPNGCTDSDAVFAKWLLPALAQTLLNLVTLGQRSKSKWSNTHFFFIILC